MVHFFNRKYRGPFYPGACVKRSFCDVSEKSKISNKQNFLKNIFKTMRLSLIIPAITAVSLKAIYLQLYDHVRYGGPFDTQFWHTALIGFTQAVYPVRFKLITKNKMAIYTSQQIMTDCNSVARTRKNFTALHKTRMYISNVLSWNFCRIWYTETITGKASEASGSANIS